MELNDPRWASLKGGYGVPFDPRPALFQLADGTDIQGAWGQLWDGLHHQGDVGEASYACVPHLVRIHEARGMPDWNTYAIVATIDLARDRRRNPTMLCWQYGRARGCTVAFLSSCPKTNFWSLATGWTDDCAGA